MSNRLNVVTRLEVEGKWCMLVEDSIVIGNPEYKLTSIPYSEVNISLFCSIVVGDNC